MNLLYCSNGIVVAFHDSSQAPVAASEYGGGICIIPYDQPMSSLDRVGPPPLEGIRPSVDTRPYAQPSETPEILKAYAGQLRWENITAGVTFAGSLGSVPVNSDRVSQTLVANLAQYAATLSPTADIDFTQDGIAYQMTAQDAIDLNNQIAAKIQQCRTIEAQCLADLNLATPTILTYADVEARFAGVRKK